MDDRPGVLVTSAETKDRSAPPRSIDALVEDVTRAVIANGGRPLPYFVISYGRWYRAKGQLQRDREALGLPFLSSDKVSVQNFLVASTPIVFVRP